jgi:glutathione S-transferase
LELFFSPLSCSLATRIALYESNQPATFHQVDTATKTLADGSDYRAINPMGQVPALRPAHGPVLTENAAILQYVADRALSAALAPTGDARYQLQKWLNFITSELHKGVFVPLLDPAAPDGAKTYARGKLQLRFDVLNAHLTGREFLLDHFTVADAYLVTVLNWAAYLHIDFSPWPALQDFYHRTQQRPAVSRAFAEEMVLFQQLQARRAA